jgi:HSP20 family protein
MTMNILRRPAPTLPTRPGPHLPALWEPSRFLNELVAWDPFRTMTPFAEETFAFNPAFEVKETPESFVFRADLPGLKESDVEIALDGDRLIIKGKRAEEKRDEGTTYYAYERTFGSFTRSFTLPSNVDAGRAKADLKEGVLTLSMPKKPESKPRTIAISR